MANPFRDMGISDEELDREINSTAESISARRERAKEAVAYAQSIAPKHEGDYAAGIEVQTVKGTIRVVATDAISEYVEYGTGPAARHNPRTQGGSSPEYAVFARTAAHFGGTSDGITT